jgi:hypothetical protein
MRSLTKDAIERFPKIKAVLQQYGPQTPAQVASRIGIHSGRVGAYMFCLHSIGWLKLVESIVIRHGEKQCIYDVLQSK